MSNIQNILRNNKLSVTEGRKKILQLFLNTEGALAHSDIEMGAGENFDRVTIYRTLHSFVEKGIIHVIPSADNSIKYALCKDECSEGHHHDHHVHLVCSVCQKTLCLDEVVVPGYYIENIEVVANGICKQCNS
jgi:Fur family ferric uptake transcriptional regulator